MPSATAAPVAGPIAMQGIAIPAAVVDKSEFFRRTRRHTQQEKSLAVTIQPATSGNSNTQDIIPLRRSDILGGVTLHLTGTLTVNIGTGTVASTAAWPYGVFKNVGFNANGASSLISARGWTLKARDVAKDEGLSDNGVQQTIGGTTRTNGTLALPTESWGVGQNTGSLASGTYNVDLVVALPVAEDEWDLSGAIFLQTSSAELQVVVNWAAITELFAFTGNGTASFAGNLQVLTTKFEIPTSGGAIIVPDLSMFHSLVETSTVALANGENEAVIVGQGAGKYVLRVLYQLQNGATPAPVPMTAANFGLQAWRYGTAETPDQFIDGSALRNANARHYNTDLGGLQGYGVHEFAKAGFRDLVSMAETADLRLVTNILSSVTLNTPKLWYAVESVYRSGQAI